MTSLSLLILFVATVALAALAVALFSAWQTHAMAASVEARLRRSEDDSQSISTGLQSRVDRLSAQFRELEQQPSVTLTPGIPKPGMNVMKRSQALRMHRRGEPPEQIAAALELARQEIELLLKVHGIVIANV